MNDFRLTPLSAAISKDYRDQNKDHAILGQVWDVGRVLKASGGDSFYVPFKMLDQSTNGLEIKAKLFSGNKCPLPDPQYLSENNYLLVFSASLHGPTWSLPLTKCKALLFDRNKNVLWSNVDHSSVPYYQNYLDDLHSWCEQRNGSSTSQDGQEEDASLADALSPHWPSLPAQKSLIVKVLRKDNFFGKTRLLLWDGTGRTNAAADRLTLSRHHHNYPPTGYIVPLFAWKHHSESASTSINCNSWIKISGFVRKESLGEVEFNTSDKHFKFELLDTSDPRIPDRLAIHLAHETAPSILPVTHSSAQIYAKPPLGNRLSSQSPNPAQEMNVDSPPEVAVSTRIFVKCPDDAPTSTLQEIVESIQDEPFLVQSTLVTIIPLPSLVDPNRTLLPYCRNCTRSPSSHRPGCAGASSEISPRFRLILSDSTELISVEVCGSLAWDFFDLKQEDLDHAEYANAILELEKEIGKRSKFLVLRDTDELSGQTIYRVFGTVFKV